MCTDSRIRIRLKKVTDPEHWSQEPALEDSNLSNLRLKKLSEGFKEQMRRVRGKITIQVR